MENKWIKCIGTTIQKYDASWMIEEIVEESNSLFRWLKVTAIWSGFGPMPIFANDKRTFFVNRQRIEDGHWM